MILTNTRHNLLFARTDGDISMSEKEWREFAEATAAPYRPRTALEFNAMCDLAIARHFADGDPMGGVRAVEVEGMKFGPNGEINFPITPEQDDYMRKHGTFPSAEDLQAYRRGEDGPGLDEVSSKPSLSVVR